MKYNKTDCLNDLKKKGVIITFIKSKVFKVSYYFLEIPRNSLGIKSLGKLQFLIRYCQCSYKWIKPLNN